MSTDKLSMALDDVIKQEKGKKTGNKLRGGPGGQRRRNAPGNNMRRNQSGGARKQSNTPMQRKKQVAPVRARRPVRSNNNQSTIKRPQNLRSSAYRRQRLQNVRPVVQRQFSGSSDDSRKTILRITGLNFNIVNQEIYDLFSKIGPLKQCRIDFDEMGRSKGSAIVQYEKPEHAQLAIKEYNGADLDQKTLNVEYLKTDGRRFNSQMPPVQRRIQKPMRNDNFRRNNNPGRQNFNRGGNNNRNQRGNRQRTFRR